MKCIYCNNEKTEVNNSREIKKGYLTWRRRFCPKCKKVFTTKETAMADNLFVMKRNGTRQRFTYEKLFVSIFTAINSRKHKDNGDDAKTAKDVCAKVMIKLFQQSADKVVSSKAIIEATYSELKKVSVNYADTYVYYSEYRFKISKARQAFARGE